LHKTYPINQRLLRRLIRLEADKVREPRLYDLDYDIQLNAALEVVQKKDFNKLVKEAKTLKELQQEAEEENKDLATTAQ
jgi:carboxyl-terminal processing protease